LNKPSRGTSRASPARRLVEGRMFWGTPAQVVAKLRAFGEAGLR
jgi:hypothetical protein